MKNNKGFTLIELMVVITIIAILSSVALIGMRSAQSSARNATRYQRYTALRAALETCYSLNQTYPATTGDTCWSTVVGQAAGAIAGSTLPVGGEGISTYTTTGSCYTLSIKIEPSGTSWPNPAGTCPQ